MEILWFFQISKWPALPLWIFEIAKFYWLLGWRGLRRISMPNFVKIGCEDIKIFWFQDGGRPPSWISLGHIWTTHSDYLGVSISLYNLLMIDAVVFVIWTFQYLTRLARKCLFTPPKLGFWGNLIPKMGSNINESQKRHILASVRVIWAIKRENVVSGLTCSCLLKKGYK